MHSSTLPPKGSPYHPGSSGKQTISGRTSTSPSPSPSESSRALVSPSPDDELYNSSSNSHDLMTKDMEEIFNDLDSKRHNRRMDEFESKVEIETPPDLPVLKDLENIAKDFKIDFSHYLFVCGQHLLNTTGSLIQTLLNMDAKPENIFVVGKSYSTNPGVKEWLKQKNIYVAPTSAQTALGKFVNNYNRDIVHLWEKVIARAQQIEDEIDRSVKTVRSIERRRKKQIKKSVSSAEISDSNPNRSTVSTSLAPSDLIKVEVQKMKEKEIKGIIVIDDGGHLLAQYPDDSELLKKYKLIGIEQTSSGIYEAQTFFHHPVIMLASSAVKRQVEPKMIADVVAQKIKENIQKITSPSFVSSLDDTADPQSSQLYVKKLKEITSLELLSDKEKTVVGIVGFGAIGQAVMLHWIEMGYKNFCVFDIHETPKTEAIKLGKKHNVKVEINKLVDNLFNGSDYIIGCTGTDITYDKLDAFRITRTPKILMSCSSKDVEFLTLLKYIQDNPDGLNKNSKSILEDVIFQNGFAHPLMVLRGGLPINFDNSPKCLLEQDAELIRALIFQSVLQADQMIKYSLKNNLKSQCYMLEPERQRLAMKLWVDRNRPSRKEYYIDKAALYQSEDTDYIASESTGERFILSGTSPTDSPKSVASSTSSTETDTPTEGSVSDLNSFQLPPSGTLGLRRFSLTNSFSPPNNHDQNNKENPHTNRVNGNTDNVNGTHSVTSSMIFGSGS